MPLVYPQDFVRKIKSEYPDHKSIHSAVDSGAYILGKYLAEEATKQMTPEAIIVAFGKSHENYVLENAKTIIRRKALHVTWLKFMSEKISSLDDEFSK